MADEKTLSFTKEVAPWYDATPICVVVFLLMAAVLGFGILGIAIGLKNPVNRTDIWFPGLLVVFSSAVILSLVVRIIKRYADTTRPEL